MGMGEGGQEIAELMIPANKVGLIIGTCVQYTVAQYARGLQSDVKCVLNLCFVHIFTGKGGEMIKALQV